MSTTIKPRQTSIVIYQGDDLERLAELRRAVTRAERESEGAPRRGGDPDAVAGAKAAYDTFVEESAERAVLVELTALGRKRFRSLMAEHPARKVQGEDGKQETHEDDEGYGVNVETFADPLLHVSITAPEFGTPADRDAFLDSLSDGDHGRLFNAAYWLNRSPGGDPKDTRYSATSRSSSAT